MANRIAHEIIVQMRLLRRKGLGYTEIATQLGKTYEAVRRNLDPAFRERRNQISRQYERERELPYHRRTILSDKSDGRTIGIRHSFTAAPPPEVIEDRDEVYSRPFDPIAELMGDPRPGRSALDRRNSP